MSLDSCHLLTLPVSSTSKSRLQFLGELVPATDVRFRLPNPQHCMWAKSILMMASLYISNLNSYTGSRHHLSENKINQNSTQIYHISSAYTTTYFNNLVESLNKILPEIQFRINLCIPNFCNKTSIWHNHLLSLDCLYNQKQMFQRQIHLNGILPNFAKYMYTYLHERLSFLKRRQPFPNILIGDVKVRMLESFSLLSCKLNSSRLKQKSTN